MRRPTTPLRRFGFTMVELLVVVLVLAILLGLLIPAVMRAVTTAKEAAVAAEINLMVQALADFKGKYGVYPPSRIVLHENGDYSPTALGTTYANYQSRSLYYRGRFGRVMVLNTTPDGGGVTPPGPITDDDFNGNGTLEVAPYTIAGPECIVFFLGGIPQNLGNGQYAMTGFAKNLSNPMIPSATASNRNPPLMEFNAGRLVDLMATEMPISESNPPNNMPEYKDSIGGNLYAYFSAYEGAGYDPDDVNVPETDPSGNVSDVKCAFMTNNDIGAFIKSNDINKQWSKPTPLGGRLDFVGSSTPNPYLPDTPIPLNSSGTADTTSNKPRTYQNANSFQIISAGGDACSASVANMSRVPRALDCPF